MPKINISIKILYRKKKRKELSGKTNYYKEFKT